MASLSRRGQTSDIYIGWNEQAMKTLTERIVDALREQGISYAPAGAAATRRVDERWSRAWPFDGFPEAKAHVAKGGIWYRWSAFRNRLIPVVRGAEAVEAYKSCGVSPFFVFDEGLEFCAKCHADHFPDLSGIGDDVYVVDSSMRWTMVYTHVHPKCGPYFAHGVNDDEAM